jgi:hypothetical protein
LQTTPGDGDRYSLATYFPPFGGNPAASVRRPPAWGCRAHGGVWRLAPTSRATPALTSPRRPRRPGVLLARRPGRPGKQRIEEKAAGAFKTRQTSRPTDDSKRFCCPAAETRQIASAAGDLSHYRCRRSALCGKSQSSPAVFHVCCAQRRQRGKSRSSPAFSTFAVPSADGAETRAPLGGFSTFRITRPRHRPPPTPPPPAPSPATAPAPKRTAARPTPATRSAAPAGPPRRGCARSACDTGRSCAP